MIRSPGARQAALRVFFYVFGMMVCASGAVLSIRSDLGVSPFSSVAYTLSLALNIDIGITTYAVFFTVIILQVIILRRDFKIVYLLQLPAATMYSFFVSMLKRAFEFIPAPSNYLIQLLYLAISLVLFAVGIAVYMMPELPRLPPDFLLIAIIRRRPSARFSTLKIILDSSMVAISVAISFIAFGALRAVREGTAISAVCIGLLIRLVDRMLGLPLRKLFFSTTKEDEEIEQTDSMEAPDEVQS